MSEIFEIDTTERRFFDANVEISNEDAENPKVYTIPFKFVWRTAEDQEKVWDDIQHRYERQKELEKTTPEDELNIAMLKEFPPPKLDDQVAEVTAIARGWSAIRINGSTEFNAVNIRALLNTYPFAYNAILSKYNERHFERGRDPKKDTSEQPSATG